MHEIHTLHNIHNEATYCVCHYFFIVSKCDYMCSTQCAVRMYYVHAVPSVTFSVPSVHSVHYHDLCSYHEQHRSLTTKISESLKDSDFTFFKYISRIL